MSVRLLGLRWTNFQSAGAPDRPSDAEGDRKDAWRVIRQAMRGESLTPECAGRIGGEGLEAALCSEYRIRPFEDSRLRYDVRYEIVLTASGGRPYPCAERLTYVETNERKTTSRRKAFDTMGLSHYKGIHPHDVMFAMGRNRFEIAQISALRLLAEGLGKSFFFFDEFRPLAQKTARLRPGAFFLRALQAYARSDESAAPQS